MNSNDLLETAGGLQQAWALAMQDSSADHYKRQTPNVTKSLYLSGVSKVYNKGKC